jgi:hypothetical protein
MLISGEYHALLFNGEALEGPRGPPHIRHLSALPLYDPEAPANVDRTYPQRLHGVRPTSRGFDDQPHASDTPEQARHACGGNDQSPLQERQSTAKPMPILGQPICINGGRPGRPNVIVA